MGDAFSRNTSDKSKSSKKQIGLACVLGVGLLVAVGYNFNFFKPRPVDAAPDVNATGGATDEDGDGLASPEAASDTIEALAHDPTAKLLRGKEDPLGQLETPPANPFALASKWRSELIKAAPVVRAPAAARPNAPMRRPTMTAYDVEQIKIQGVVMNGGTGVAIINGKPLSVGNIVAGAKILDIQQDHIVVHPLSYPEGATMEIRAH